MALLIFLPAAAPAGFIAAQFGFSAFERLVVHHIETVHTDFVDRGLFRLSDSLARFLDYVARHQDAVWVGLLAAFITIMVVIVLIAA